ncbi:MAG TPA: DUF1579 family protein [Candidatus Eisenbacteria bacterium]|nr:DUF1579 family protein [Candidatus Eisenbacteria bacterium]
MPSDREAAIAAAVAVFQKDVGEWDAVLEVRPQPGAPPLVQKGVYRNRMVGGRWLIVDYSSDSGFEGHGVYGWDHDLGKYVGTWVDSMQGSIARSIGTWDPAARTMTFETEATHGGRPFRYREITQAMPDGTQVYRNLVPLPTGEEFEMIRSVYRRRS